MSGATTTADVSVVVPAYRAADTIAAALASVAAQTLKPAEVIVVDDGSDDGTAAAAEACRPWFAGARFEVVTQSNGGPGAARNAALTCARCEAVAFLDADDEWFPEHLARAIAKLHEDGLTLSAHNEILVEDGRESLNDSLARLGEHPDPLLALYRKGCISTSTVVANRAALVAVGGFDASLSNGQDVDLWLAVLSRPGASFAIMAEPLSRYIVRATGVNANIAKRHRCFIAIAKRWAGTMAARDRGRIADLWFRISAIHYETFRGLLGRGQFGAALASCLAYPVNLIDIARRGLLKQAPDRNLASFPPVTEA